MTATIPSVSLVSHSVFPFCPLYPTVFCLISIIFHNLFSANISHLFSSPLSLLDCLNWNDVFVSCCSVSNLNRMFFSFSEQPKPCKCIFCNLYQASLAMLFRVFFLFHGLGIKRRSLISVPLFSLLLQPVSCLLGCFRYMVVWALVWTGVHLWGLTAEFHWERAWESEREEKRVRGTVCKKWVEEQREERKGRRK